MRFCYHPQAGETKLHIDGDRFVHLFKARRQKVGQELFFRNLRTPHRYCYQIEALSRREAQLSLLRGQEEPAWPCGAKHLAWCVVDTKTIERTLPFLNELGLKRLSLLWCRNSQRNFQPDFERFERILIASCEQCGRGSLMPIEVFEYGRFLEQHPLVARLDFRGTPLSLDSLKDRVLIVGPEGGFGAQELQGVPAFGLSCTHTLRSETAIIAAAGRLLG